MILVLLKIKSITLRNHMKKKPQGRPKKLKSEVSSKQVTIKLTESELLALKEKSGLIPLATFIKNELFKNTNIFK